MHVNTDRYHIHHKKPSIWECQLTARSQPQRPWIQRLGSRWCHPATNPSWGRRFGRSQSCNKIWLMIHVEHPIGDPNQVEITESIIGATRGTEIPTSLETCLTLLYFLTLPQVPEAKCFGCHSASGMLQPAMCRLAPSASPQSQGANHEYPAPQTPVFF